ncbi:hypothetical protein ACFOY5_05170 [Massilia aurea]|jgi:hypothetical protein|uniref:hypothetical protein n=1 Tax=Massilia aurea TaxID=373040 RepID=UPI002162E28D|nr:hypothetical protein [Massilia aurea]MCS0709123.1 hypothetical protein [Massilia aurea]
MYAVPNAFHDLARASGGPKDPPSAPPAIPPIIITPFNRDTPAPNGDPRPIPVGPPIMPPPGPSWRCPRIVDDCPA